ncbi:hypothetical protein GRX03_06610 [Halovenus sp. WSH3]|uniref:Uncharacterized protein n=1 Tax=Halovenus carboxidivorans TaxID=2692199 RepID=A0A6B0T0C3_9EURY|nr:hypothetical protein [Halovenus carboxidivorans]MXR51275.1 hypothetical protein [Halovenus carboxidivorans]
MTDTTLASDEWWEEYRAVVNEDTELTRYLRRLRPVLANSTSEPSEPLAEVFRPADFGSEPNQ